MSLPRRSSLAISSYDGPRVTEVLVFSWHHFLSPAAHVEARHEQRFPYMAIAQAACKSMDRSIVDVLSQGICLGFVFVVVEATLDAFAAEIAAYFPHTGRWLEKNAAAVLIFKPQHASANDMYADMLREICRQVQIRRRSQPEATLALTVFGPRALRAACRTLADSYPILPKAIYTTEDTASVELMAARLRQVEEHLASIIHHATPLDLSLVRPVDRPSVEL
ncbi:hypothetical protein ACHHYP_09307 [Achlya hypogyna]|uniref:Uncharacterized protein n=1 Tax=Achlya hypogyna TaxID=1202772 RepID=A0A1V9YNP3_ACHHY|nr:hypothetical protein ACHHYP_09307 [Achlya hypogyna]